MLDLHLYGLLHVREGERSAMNVRVRGIDRQIDLYLRNAVGLARSLRRNGVQFTLVTNLPEEIAARAARLEADTVPDIAAIAFSVAVPSGISFYSAHHKLDLLRHLASLPADGHVGVVDLDVVALRPPPPALREAIAARTPIVYDITAQVVPAYGRESVLGDLEGVLGHPSEGRWYGGELLAGPPEFFSDLCAHLPRLYDSYLANRGRIRHQGDEAVVSAGIELLRRQGRVVKEAGELRLVARYWSVPTLHDQAPLAEAGGAFLLHLPADKKYLARVCLDESLGTPLFLEGYRRQLERQRLPQALKATVRRFGAHFPTRRRRTAA